MPRLRCALPLNVLQACTTGARAEPVSLASLLLLWSLTVPEPTGERLFGRQALTTTPAEVEAVLPARMPPLHDNAWSPQQD